MNEQLNPFRFGALALDEAFTDRERELRELRADLLNGQDVVVFGRRRLGKTSLVLRVAHDLGRRRVLVGYCDLMRAPTKEKLAELLAKTIHEEIASPLFRARERALEFFRGLRVQPQITIDPEDASVSFGFQPGQREEDLDATIERLLELPAQLAAERGRRVALVLDEFQELVDIDPHLLKLMRATFQTHPEVAHVYLGSKRHLMRRIFNDENEPFWRSAKQFELGPIAPEAFAPFLAERFRATGRRIAGDAVEALLAVTGGHPYATQQFAYFAWEEGTRVGLAELWRALERVVQSEHTHFSLLWDGATANERLLLLALAAEPGRPYSAPYRRAHALPAATNVQRALRGLVTKELVDKDADGLYRIIEPFLAEWLRRTQLA